MPAPTRESLLCRYQYDALDRLVDSSPFEQPSIQRYYCKTRLATEIQDAMQTCIFQHEDQLIAQQQSQSGHLDTTLLATDQQRSVFNALDATKSPGYSPYGHRPQGNGLLSLLGFNGERPDPLTGHYHLGIGYRQYNPVLMRFNSPDSWSPFGKGGLNAYAYCAGDPVNSRDPTGHFLGKFIARLNKNLAEPLSHRAHNLLENSYKSLGRSKNLRAMSTAAKDAPERLLMNTALNDGLSNINSTLKQLENSAAEFHKNNIGAPFWKALDQIERKQSALNELATAGQKLKTVDTDTFKKVFDSNNEISKIKDMGAFGFYDRLSNIRQSTTSNSWMPSAPPSSRDPNLPPPYSFDDPTPRKY